MAATAPSSCTTFVNLRANATNSKVVVRSSSPGCSRNIDGVAMWIINGVASAFFASLERCSCIRIATVDDHDADDSNDLPLIFNDGNNIGTSTGGVGGAGSTSKAKGKWNLDLLKGPESIPKY